MNNSLHTILLGRKVHINKNLSLPQWKPLEGTEASIASIWIDGGYPKYTILTENGVLLQADSWVFYVVP